MIVSRAGHTGENPSAEGQRCDVRSHWAHRCSSLGPCRDTEPEGPWDARGRARGRTHAHAHRTSLSLALKVEFTFTAIRQLEDKWLNAFGGKEERLPPQRTGEWLTAGWRETPGNINPHLTNWVYQRSTIYSYCCWYFVWITAIKLC